MRTERNGIAETHEYGWGRVLLRVVVGTGVTLVFVYGMLWVWLQNAQTASGVMVVLLVFLVLLATVIGCMSFGMRMGTHNSRDMVQGVASELRDALLTQAVPVVIDGDYRTVTPTAQLPEGKPESKFIPRFTQNGMAAPFGMQFKNGDSVTLQTYDKQGQKINIQSDTLMKFIQLSTPARREFTGDKELYGDALKWCEAVGLLRRTENNGAKWQGTTVEDRAEWVAEISKR